MTRHLACSPDTVHWGHWKPAMRPVLTVEPGETVTVDTVNGGAAVIDDCPFDVLDDHRAIVDGLEPEVGPHIMTGPIAVNGARFGDVLEVEILDVALRQDWGWNWFRPLRGALPDDFPYARKVYSPIDRKSGTVTLDWGPTLALKPFFGILSVAPPPAWEIVSSVEPRTHGGNIDNKELVAGSSVYFPVFNDGALFSCGDGHGLQGDGEVCLTGLETALTGTFRFSIHRSHRLGRPTALTPTHLITMGFHPDLDHAADIALRDMITLLARLKDWSADEAYIFCSLACDLHVTQVVDGNKGVHAMVERAAIEPFELF